MGSDRACSRAGPTVFRPVPPGSGRIGGCTGGRHLRPCSKLARCDRHVQREAQMYVFQPVDRGLAVAAVGEPVPGSRHDARDFHESGLADQLEGMVECGDKGYQGHVEFSPHKRRSKTGRLDPDIVRNNSAINSMRAAVERAIAHLKGWRMLATPFRASLHKFRDAYMAIVALYFFKWLDFPPSA